MARSALNRPQTDPALLFELFRGSFTTELLVAAVAHFDLFAKLQSAPLSFEELRTTLELEPRAANVLVTAIRAMGLITESAGKLALSAMAREHLVAGNAFDISDYIRMAQESPGVQAITERLKTNRPAGADKKEEKDSAGVAFIYRKGMDSAMEQEASARKLTMALAGRAKNVAPALAHAANLQSARVLLDVGGGTGLYSIAILQKNPALRAIVWDRPEVLKVAAEMAAEYGVEERLECRPGDMFSDAVPDADAVLLSNILHDWDVPECRELLDRLSGALPRGGRLFIHDVFLNDALDGPLPVALYSAALFCLCEGRAYSAAEYSQWMKDAGLKTGAVVPTLAHCGVLTGIKG